MTSPSPPLGGGGGAMRQDSNLTFPLQLHGIDRENFSGAFGALDFGASNGACPLLPLCNRGACSRGGGWGGVRRRTAWRFLGGGGHCAPLQ